MKRKIAEHLLNIQAVFLSPDKPFVWASGIKSPIYCDNRITLSDHLVRADIEKGLAELIIKNYPQCEVIMGTSTAGIAHAAITAHILGLPMGYVRSSAKDHGRGNRIEGRLLPGQKTVVIEDLISTAGSVIDTVEALREEEAQVLGIASIFTYGMAKGIQRLKETNVQNISLTDFDTIIEVACEKGYIKQNDKNKLLTFRDNPSDEGWIEA
jgi:orotate phosphoribosyltransferase